MFNDLSSVSRHSDRRGWWKQEILLFLCYNIFPIQTATLCAGWRLFNTSLPTDVLLFHFMPLLNRPKAKWHSVSQAKQPTIIITQGNRDALSWQPSPKPMDDWDPTFSHIHILSQMSARSYCFDGSRPRRVDVGEKWKCSLGSTCMYLEVGR